MKTFKYIHRALLVVLLFGVAMTSKEADALPGVFDTGSMLHSTDNSRRAAADKDYYAASHQDGLVQGSQSIHSGGGVRFPHGQTGLVSTATDSRAASCTKASLKLRNGLLLRHYAHLQLRSLYPKHSFW